jgi:hypothetical protein
MRRFLAKGRAPAAAALLSGWVTLLLTLAAPVARAASPPSAFTGEAALLAVSTATLRGTVYPGNQPTNYYFQYGPSASYDAQTPAASLAAATQALHVSSPLTGLAAGTLYHFRLAAVNASGTVYGQDRTFQTKSTPLTITLAALPARLLFGTPLALHGTLAGTAKAGRPVVLQANPFPYLAGFDTLGVPSITDSAGQFTFPALDLSQNTQLRVATLTAPPIRSSVVVALVSVRVSLHVARGARHGLVRMYGTLTPAQAPTLLNFQLLRRGRPPLTLSRMLKAGGRARAGFSRLIRIPGPGLYRVNASVATGAELSNHSHAVRIG